ncbi:RraA family protein [Streptomyces sp. NPDC058739]|uniref:RraA family protein n=1 Tax=Streptomyces sp. NPDC058739 TaxID=3346618 RepID=UPI0036C2616B
MSNDVSNPVTHEVGHLPRLDERELCDRYSEVPTAAINDVLRAHGLLHQVLPPAVAPLNPTSRIAGIAFTIKGSKNLVLENEMEERAAMLEAVTSNSVCVWDTSADDESAQWGEVMTLAAMRQGARGAVIDGGVRDTERVLELGFPVFCRYRTSNGMLGRFRMSAWQTPVRIGSVTIEPGDVIVGDLDGVIVVPRNRVVEVLLAAETIQEQENDIKSLIHEGLTPREVVERGGYF